MAYILTSYQQKQQDINKYPIIHCEKDRENIKALSINKILSERLIDINPNRRSLKIAKLIEEILDASEDIDVIKDFDVLFNPSYDIDVLKLFVDLAHNSPIEIIWPGSYEDEKLIYSEQDYKDYKVYDLSKYDLACVI